MSGKAAASAPSTPVPQTQTQSSQPQPDTTAEPSPPIAVPAIPKITIPATISLPPPVPLPPQVKRPAPRQSEGQEAWDDDDETALITFLAANSQRNQIPVNEWHALALQVCNLHRDRELSGTILKISCSTSFNRFNADWEISNRPIL